MFVRSKQWPQLANSTVHANQLNHSPVFPGFNQSLFQYVPSFFPMKKRLGIYQLRPCPWWTATEILNSNWNRNSFEMPSEKSFGRHNFHSLKLGEEPLNFTLPHWRWESLHLYRISAVRLGVLSPLKRMLRLRWTWTDLVKSIELSCLVYLPIVEDVGDSCWLHDPSLLKSAWKRLTGNLKLQKLKIFKKIRCKRHAA